MVKQRNRATGRALCWQQAVQSVSPKGTGAPPPSSGSPGCRVPSPGSGVAAPPALPLQGPCPESEPCERTSPEHLPSSMAFHLQCAPGSQVTEPGHICPLSAAAGAVAEHRGSTGCSREWSSPVCHPGSLQGLSLGHQAGSVLDPLLRCFWKFTQGPKPQQSATTSVQAKGFQGNLSHHPRSSPSSCSPSSSGPCSDPAPPRLVWAEGTSSVSSAPKVKPRVPLGPPSPAAFPAKQQWDCRRRAWRIKG